MKNRFDQGNQRHQPDKTQDNARNGSEQLHTNFQNFTEPSGSHFPNKNGAGKPDRNGKQGGSGCYPKRAQNQRKNPKTRRFGNGVPIPAEKKLVGLHMLKKKQRFFEEKGKNEHHKNDGRNTA